MADPRKPSDDPPMGGELAGTLPRLLLRAFGMVEADLIARLDAAGIAGIRPRHLALLRVLDEEGTRVGELARLTGVTRQAASQSIAQLTAMGYLTQEPDPRDGRAKLVRYTDEGHDAFRRGIAILAALDQEYVERLGPTAAANLRAALASLLESG